MHGVKLTAVYIGRYSLLVIINHSFNSVFINIEMRREIYNITV